MSQPPQYPPGNPPPGGTPPGGWGTPPGPGGPPGSGGFPPPGGGPGSPYGGPTGRNNTPIIVVVVVIAVALIGGSFFLLTQGGDDRSEEEQAYIDAMTEAGLANQDGDQLRLDENEARCFATAVVDTFGVETLLEEASPEEIRSNPENDPLEDIEVSLQHAEGIYDSTSGCIDYRDLLIASLGEDSGLSSEQVDCVNRSLSDEHVRDLLVAQFAQDDDASAEAGDTADEATENCNLPE